MRSNDVYIVHRTKRFSSFQPHARRMTFATSDEMDGAGPMVYFSMTEIPITPSGKR